MASLESVLQSRDITLLTKGYIIKAMDFPEVMRGCESWITKKLSSRELMLFNCGAGKTLESQGDQTSQSYKKSTLNIHWKD